MKTEGGEVARAQRPSYPHRGDMYPLSMVNDGDFVRDVATR
jgi:hypothetical protein